MHLKCGSVQFITRRATRWEIWPSLSGWPGRLMPLDQAILLVKLVKLRPFAPAIQVGGS